MESLRSVLNTYCSSQMSLAEEGKEANLSFMIRNGLFTQQGLHWLGDGFTAIDGETAEQFSHTYDNSQILRNLPVGQYRLVADAFYRAGAIAEAYAAWQSNRESALRAEIYASDPESGVDNGSILVHSLYDSEKYTYSPYTYPDNLITASTALNSTDGSYTNMLEFTLQEPSDVRIGIRNTNMIQLDWTAFDNFRLYYVGLPTSIRQLDEKPVVDNRIYDLSGRAVGVDSSSAAIHTLPSGIYIINGKKVVITGR